MNATPTPEKATGVWVSPRGEPKNRLFFNWPHADIEQLRRLYPIYRIEPADAARVPTPIPPPAF